MNENLLLTLGAVAPVALTLLWTWRRDRLPEPPHVVIATFFFGALLTVPILLIELALSALLGLEQTPTTLVQAIAVSFVIAALVEESFKLLVLSRYAATHSAFDEPYDGIVYGVAASLGFACIENVAYVLRAKDGGFESGLLVAGARAALAVPLHTSCGAIMGVCISIARFKGGAARRNLTVTGFALAVLLHGLYDTFAFAAPAAISNDSSALTVIAFLGVLLTTVMGIGLSIAGAAWLRRSQ